MVACDRRRPFFLLGAVALVACNGLLGLDDRPDRDASDDGDASDAAPSDYCAALGLSCADPSTCLAVYRPAEARQNTAACGAPTGSLPCGGVESSETFMCGAGQICVLSLEPGPQLLTACTPLCGTADGLSLSCPADMYCSFSNPVVGAPTTTGLCYYCAPTAGFADACDALGQTCVLADAHSIPKCAPKSALGTGQNGAACDPSTPCARGFVCECGAGINADCASGGVCRMLCSLSPCPSGTACSGTVAGNSRWSTCH